MLLRVIVWIFFVFLHEANRLHAVMRCPAHGIRCGPRVVWAGRESISRSFLPFRLFIVLYS